jgi:PAS domain S-box-containing protein
VVIKAHREAWRSSLAQPTAHLVQLYESSHFLGFAVAEFLAAGVERGEPGLVIATPEHRATIEAALRQAGTPTESVKFVDAASTLARFCTDRLDEPAFEAVIDELVGERTRAYGEMVVLLWRAGNPALAVELELMWQHAIDKRGLAVMCGYPLDALCEHSDEFERVCLSHSQVLPSESVLELQTSNEELTLIARLQQQAKRLTSELALRRQSEAFVHSIVDNSRDCIKVLDRDGRLLFMSKGGMEILEICDFIPIEGASWIGFWDGEDRVNAAAAVAKAREGGVGELVGFFPLTQSKQPRWWHVVVSPIREDDGRIDRLLAVSRDVTEQRRLEQDLRRSIEARDEFMSIASHELRTPITSLQLQIEMTAERLHETGSLSPDALARLVDTAGRQVTRLATLVESMLDVTLLRSSALPLACERTNLSDLVGGVFERFRAQFDVVHSDVTLTLAPDLIGVWDRSRLEQIVENLLANALKYAPGTPLAIVTARSPVGVRVAVQDGGPGISVERQATIFDRFERSGTPRTFGGLGLGLYIAKQIALAHGGTIAVDSTPGGGATFTLELPLTSADQAPVLQSA